MLRGLTALSVEIMSRRSAPKRAAVLANSQVPRALLRTAARGSDSIGDMLEGGGVQPPAPVTRMVLPAFVVPRKGAFTLVRVQFATKLRARTVASSRVKSNAAGSRWPGRRDHQRQPNG